MGANDLKVCDRRSGESLNGLTSRLLHVPRPVPALAASAEEIPLISLWPASLGVVITLEVILKAPSDLRRGLRGKGGSGLSFELRLTVNGSSMVVDLSIRA